jgi:hypothetical protein
MLLKLRRIAAIAIFAILMFVVRPAVAQELSPSSEPYGSQQLDHPDEGPHIEFSSSDGWAWGMVLVILLGLFLPAAIIGPWIRKRVGAEIPELHVREERNPLTASQHEPGHSRPR